MSGFSTNYNYQDINNSAWNDLYLDSYGNIAFIIDDIDDIIETCIHTVLLTKEDWIFDINIGIDWEYYLLTDRNISAQLRSDLTNILLTVNGVKSIESIIFDTNKNRKLIIKIKIKTDNDLLVEIPIITT